MLGRSGVELYSDALLQVLLAMASRRGRCRVSNLSDHETGPYAQCFVITTFGCMQGRGDVDCGGGVPLQVLLCLGGV